MTKKTESVEEYLARGGKIEKVPPAIEEEKDATVRGTAITPATLYHITEGEILFAEKRKSRKKKKKTLSKDEVLAKMQEFKNNK